jgi:hypothetical protein
MNKRAQEIIIRRMITALDRDCVERVGLGAVDEATSMMADSIALLSIEGVGK